MLRYTTRKCPKCHGNIFIDSDYHEGNCLQCGYSIPLAQLRALTVEKPQALGYVSPVSLGGNANPTVPAAILSRR